MRLRTQLAILLTLFAILPLAAAFVPVTRSLSHALSSEQAARLDGAARALTGELSRLSLEARAKVAELGHGPEAEAFSHDLASGALSPADAAARGAEWMQARGLDVLSLVAPDGKVVTSGHLPGRAGDVNPQMGEALSAPEGSATAMVVTRAGPSGPAPALALVAWTRLPGDADLRLVGGLSLGEERARRLAELTGGEVIIRGPDGAALAEAVAPESAGAPLLARLGMRLGAGLPGARRTLPIGPPGTSSGAIEVSVASLGLARAEGTVLVAFLGALLAGAVFAVLLGGLVASRVTRPLEALREAAVRVASGDLKARVSPVAKGEVLELVTAFNRMTSDLDSGRQRLAQAERVAAWREVARRLAHEIKNPLTPIAMSVETLRDAHAAGRNDFKEIFDEGTRAIGEEVRRLKRIVDEFSRFARLPAPEKTPVSPDELVGAVLALYPEPPARVRIVREEAPELPAVLADRDQVLQLLLNLLRNALEAMPQGGTLTIGARSEEGGIAFSVADTGVGIKEEDLPHVFEPYFTKKEGGTGLGLAIAGRIAEEHGGRLVATSPGGRGATFTLWLPRA